MQFMLIRQNGPEKFREWESDFRDVYAYLESLRACLLYTSDAADERSSVDLGGRRIIKKKTHTGARVASYLKNKTSHN